MRKFVAIFTCLFLCHVVADEQLPDLEIKEIKPGVYLHKSYSHVDGYGLVSSNGLVVIEGKSAFMIDTPWSASDTEKLVHWVNERDVELAGSFSTHSHDDRAAGIAWLNSESIPTYATALTNQILVKEGKEPAASSIDTPDFWLLDDSVEVFYPGGGHTIDNVVVWVPKFKLLFGGCFVRSLGSQSLGYTGEAHIDEWPDSVDKVLAKYPEVEVIIPGHGEAGDIRLLEHTKQLAESSAD